MSDIVPRIINIEINKLKIIPILNFKLKSKKIIKNKKIKNNNPSAALSPFIITVKTNNK